jgi:putative addiction module CopG family antidote
MNTSADKDQPMHITLSQPDLERFVEEKVRSGEYATPEAVVENALATLRLHENVLPSGEELRRLIVEGQAEADRGELLDGADVFRNLLARNDQRPRQS